MVAKRFICIRLKRNVLPLISIEQLAIKWSKSLTPPSSMPNASLATISLPQNKILPKLQKASCLLIGFFWKTYRSDKVKNFFKMSKNFEMYARRIYYIYKWLGLFMHRLLNNKKIALFVITTPK